MTPPIGPQTVSSEWTRRLASLVATIRPDWDEPGITSVLRKVCDRPLAQVARAAITCAIERTDQRTPACIALDGHHWADSPAKAPTRIDASPLLCEHGHRPARCEACATAPRSAGPTPEQRAQIRAGIEAGRQATHQLARPHQPNTQEDQA